MSNRRKNFALFLISISVILVSSCTLKYSPRTGEEFPREIVGLEKVARENPDPAVRARAHLQLARLYTHYRNPQRDYLKGGKEYAAYLSLAPGEQKEDEEAQNWVLALKELEESEQEVAALKRKMVALISERSKKEASLELELRKNQELQTNLEKLQSRLENLEKTNRSLKESQEMMKEMIEKLKKLDLQMEEKRKTIR